MAWLLFFTRCHVFCDLLQYTQTEKCNLFVLYNKNSNSLLKDFGAWKKKNKSRRDLIWIWCHLCVSFNRSRSTTNEKYKCTQKSCYCINYITCMYTLRMLIAKCILLYFLYTTVHVGVALCMLGIHIILYVAGCIPVICIVPGVSEAGGRGARTPHFCWWGARICLPPPPRPPRFNKASNKPQSYDQQSQQEKLCTYENLCNYNWVYVDCKILWFFWLWISLKTGPKTQKCCSKTC